MLTSYILELEWRNELDRKQIEKVEVLRIVKLAKEQLSDEEEVVVSIPLPFVLKSGSIAEERSDASAKERSLRIVITRKEFELAIKETTDKVVALVLGTVTSWRNDNTVGSDTLMVNKGNLVIDEIVMVGGTSRIPIVRSSIRIACGLLGLEEFSELTESVHQKKLCTSLNPDLAVVEGLAVRGAVVSGVDTHKLKDLLFLDCLAVSIGVLTWETETVSESSTDNGRKTKPSRIFDPILLKGDKLPAKRSVSFPLADRKQKFVSLDIYEEIEEFRLCNSSKLFRTSDDEEQTSTSATSDHKGLYEAYYKYNIIATHDIPVPPGSSNNILLLFETDNDGILKFDVERPDTDVRNEVSSKDSNSYRVLVIYIVLMFMLYLAAKAYLVEVEVVSNGKEL